MKDNSQDGSSEPVLASYTCPGELYSIPREIHLARLAAYYSKCRDCEHRFDSDRVYFKRDEPKSVSERPATRTTLVSEEGVRGVYLNELDRNRALLWGEAIAALLWEEQPMMAMGKPPEEEQVFLAVSAVGSRPAAFQSPTVVVGFDERPSSPDIVTGVVLGLRRMGCSVIDLGQTMLPTLAFHVFSKDANGGLFVTGAGCNPSWTGFDILKKGAGPISLSGLQQIEQFVKNGVGRQTRQIGAHRPYQGQAEYEASLESGFHALRPLKIVCGTSTRMLPRALDRLFAKLPCDLIQLALPTRQRNLFDPRDVDLVRVATKVVEGQFHLGLIIDDDGRHSAFITDKGRLVTPREIARLLIEVALREHHAGQFILSTCWLAEARKWLEGREAIAIDGGEAASEIVARLTEREALMALSADGRVWYRQTFAACDALLVLAGILQALSLSDAPFSDVVSRIPSANTGVTSDTPSRDGTA